MVILDAAEEYIAEIKRLRPGTQRDYTQKLRAFVTYCGERGIDLGDVKNRTIQEFVEHLRETIKPLKKGKDTPSSVTYVGYVRVIRSFLNWCAGDEEFEKHVSHRTLSRIKLPKMEHKIVEVFRQEQIEALKKACDREPTPELRLRAKAILLLLLDTGIRADELCSLKLKDTHTEPKESYIKVMGKGRKEREITLSDEARRVVKKYIRDFRSFGEFTFVSRVGEPLTVSGLYQLISRLGEWANITDVRCSPHTFRHTYSTLFMRNGGDIYTLSRTLGHTSLSVTEEYLKTLSSRDVRRRDT